MFAVLVTLLLGACIAGLGVRQVNYWALNSQLQSSGLHISAKVRQLLIISQVALTAVLLVACLQLLQQALEILPP
ncbi:hypothetical protein [Alkalimonas amylolytica]|uniref:Uncharacterized protein n=1 Tax=Alkalimonas amylolytica TaxID=152573 RepID=A0A1H4G4U5_ALKAM|nr:hypothetical protein [Alkalimonas amylolytica]SEB04311.1 hypothetical protein SAMN04488051_11818 [Alkalimonas amylolytica]